MSKEGIHAIAVSRKDILRIDPLDIHIRPEWNCRDVNFNPTDADDLALAESIASVGVKQAMTAVWQDGQAWLTDGHRRLGATLYAIETLGAEIKSVPVQTEDRYASEADRVLSQLVRNNGKPLSPIEQARVYKRLIDLGWTEKQIADSIGRSVPWVKNLLELHAAPNEVAQMVRSGQVSATLAMDTLKKAGGNGEKAVKELAGAVEKAKASGKTRATAKHMEPERKTLDQLADELDAASKQWHNAEIQHVKSGGRYRIVGFHFRESDMALCVEYCPLDGLKEIGFHPAAGTICTVRVKFARSVSEMAFGSRFIFCGGTLQ